MKKYIFLFLAVLLIALPLPVLAKNNAGNFDGHKIVTLRADEEVDGNYYAAGELVEIFGTVHGDVYAAGGQVIVNGVIDGDLLVAGGTVTISGTIGEDVRAAGGQITINALVGKNLSVAGGNVEVTDTAKVDRALHIVGGNLYVSAPVGEELYSAGGNLTLTNNVGKSLQAAVGALRVTSNANINGNLDYWSEEEAMIDSSASISGTMTRHDIAMNNEMRNVPSQQTISNIGKSIALGIKATTLAITLIIGLLLIRIFPSYSDRAATTLKDRLSASIGYGFVGAMAAVLLFIILLISIIGIPLALLEMVWLIVYMYLARIFALLALGRFILVKVEGKTRSGWAFVVGAVVYYIVTMIPVIGGLFKIVFILAAFGALLLNDKATYKLARKQKVV